MSHPSWVCGLKPRAQYGDESAVCHTLRGCVDWNLYCGTTTYENICHTLRGCVDWNKIFPQALKRYEMSHPSWVCGLKLVLQLVVSLALLSHPSWVCGLKRYDNDHCKSCDSHTLRGCVDWNDLIGIKEQIRGVTPFVGVWIETLFRSVVFCARRVTPFVGVWIETYKN